MATNQKRVLVTSWLVEADDPALDVLRDAGHEVIMGRTPRPCTEEYMLDAIKGIDGVVAGSDCYNARVVEVADRLKVIVRVGVGYDTIDVAAATAKGIVVGTTPGTNDRAVADYAFGLMLAIARQIPTNDRTVKAGRWDRPSGVDVNNKTLGIVGLGAIGRNVARRARGFDMRVLAYDVVQNPDFAAAHNVEFSDLDTIFQTADFVTLHAPSTPETRGLVNAARLKSMKAGAYLINTARGDLIDMDALDTALKERWIAGAALDVFPKEPPIGTPLAELENAILSPHVAGMSVEANAAASLMACQSVVKVLNGEKALYAVNPEVYGP